MKAEQILQINLVNWFHETFPELADDFHHFANERKCSVYEGRILKRMAVKKGVADIHLALPTFWFDLGSAAYFNGLWLELKIEGGKLSQEQIDFLERKNQRGYFAIGVVGFEAAKRVILTYLHGYITNRDKLLAECANYELEISA